MVIQARLRLRHHGCLSERVLDGARVIHMSGDDKHCLSIFKANGPEHLDELLRMSAPMLEPDGIIDRAPDWAMVRCHCPAGGSRIVPVIRRNEATIVWPVIEAEGLEHYTLLVRSRVALRNLVAELSQQADVVVERATNINGPSAEVNVSLSDVTEGLTARQLEVLQLAVARGYYESPRSAYAEELAQALRMSRSTFQEHLQKAESLVMKTFSRLVLEHPGLALQAAKRRGRPAARHADNVAVDTTG